MSARIPFFDKPFVWPLFLFLWASLIAVLIHGFPPCVDLPAHAAQIETLANLLRGDPAVSAFYRIKFSIGYGLVFWLSLPFAFIWNGAVAARIAWWVSLFLWPLSIDSLRKSFGLSRWVVLLSLPFAFNMNYWYGYLPFVFAEPLVFFGLAAAQRLFTTGKRRWVVALNLIALLALLAHLICFAVLAFLVGILALCTKPRLQSIWRGIAGLLLPLGFSAAKVFELLTVAVHPGAAPATEFQAMAHLNWFFKTYGPEGHLAAAGAALVTVLLVGFALWRKPRAWGPLVLTVAMAALYMATPKTLSGIFLVCVRLPVFVAVLALLVIEVRTLPSLVRSALLALTLWSLAETVIFHARFARAVAGLDEAIASFPQGMHGFWAPAGNQILGSKHIYVEHLGQWVTATRGGVGQNFFADDEHHPVRFRDADVPADISLATDEQRRPFQHVLVFGEGSLPPAWTTDFHLAWRNAHYQRFDHN